MMSRLNTRQLLRRAFPVFGCFLVAACPGLFAVVGQAERFDEFREEDLNEFHQELLQEERQVQMEETLKMLELDAQAGDADYEAELAKMKHELLQIPKKDRVKFGASGQYVYESNVSRKQLRQEKGDSIFDAAGYVEFDLGGRKTDLRAETRGAKQWNIHFPNSDFIYAEERLRYRRKYFKKVTHSVQSRLARHSSKTIEMDVKKVRWDSHQNMNFNYAFSRKLSLNTEMNWIKRVFTTEPYDQDSQWQVEFAPSAFWHITPKSRVFLGYTTGASRIRTKSGDANSHEVHFGYFGRLSRKTSMSMDLSYSHQSPRSLDTPVSNSYKIGKGLIWQMTPKTQATLQVIRSVQDTSSNRVEDTENESVKSDIYYVNHSLSISLNSRLTRKVTAVADFNVSHYSNKVKKGDNKEDLETQHITLPMSMTVNYYANRFLRLRLRYTFTYRLGDEKPDNYRAHILMNSMDLTF